MCRGFKGLCEDFLLDHPGYYIVPVRISGSAIESVFSCLKYIAGGNLLSVNYASSLSALVTQNSTSTCNSKGENGYRNVSTNLN